MELCDASHLFPTGLRRGPFPSFRFTPSSSSLLQHPRSFLCRHIWHSMQLQNDLKTTLHPRIHFPPPRSPAASVSYGDSAITCKGLCKVVWTVEADVLDRYLIFITGDLVSLGCWEPEMAVLLFPCIENTNLWKTEIKVPFGINFKYNYFIKEDKHRSSNLVWRPGPEFSLSIPFTGREDEQIVVRDSWMSTKINRQPIPSWGSWLMEISLFKDCLKNGEKEILQSHNGVPSKSKHSSVDCHHEEIREDIEILVQNSTNAGEDLTERDQPVEEPWLLRSIFSAISGSSELDELSHQDKEKLAPIDDHKIAHVEKPASTVILINSSVCTMQRIAVLEEEKLVELLLEPVKNNVQCDNIYLGVVTKLVPHMGGAFVDIGISRPSLMEIKQNREPFVYPPFHEDNDESIGCSSESELKENFISNQDELSSDDEDDVVDEFLDVDHQDDSTEFIEEHIEYHEIEDDVSPSHDSKPNIVNGAIDLSIHDAHFEGNGDQIEDEDEEDAMLLEAESSNDLDSAGLSQQYNKKVVVTTHTNENKWSHVRKGTKIIVQVVKEGLGTKGPALSPYPNLRSRFWILIARCDRIGVSKKITGVERTRLKVIAKTLQPPGFGLTVRTVAAGHSLEELQKDLDGLLSTWKGIVEHAKSAALAAEEGVEGAVPVILHKAMGQTLSVVQDYFNEKVKSMIVDSPRTYHEVTRYLQEIAPDLCKRVELYDKKTPIFDEYNVEEEINGILSKRVSLSNGGSLVIEQTEALVSIDVNGGHSMLGQGTSQERAVLDVNLAAAKQIARELRLRDIGGIIVVDFIDMVDDSNKRLVYEEMKKAVERDRSTVRVSELSKLGLMEITRKRVRPSVSFMISEPCVCCHATGRVEGLETSFSKIEHEICRLLAASNKKPDPENPKSWPRFVLRVDRYMCNYLTSGKKTKLAALSSSLKVWILLKVARGFSRGTFEVRPFTDDKVDDDQQVTISRLWPAETRNHIPRAKLTLFPIKKLKSRGK
ncbi:ribonuclease E/G-like protein, chloroplastic isoform X1 [Ananas comosus]|uniref:Ribonuclease E/G-like protein, chloroplastic isoform X1 n=2 Tax=Ananas comosus TaxID=4615 RepID=A0A6P5GPS3_ANACO|nr:ribonuclease E/G-like protein, chloroplastic isoform X1 [Ananas comosus]